MPRRPATAINRTIIEVDRGTREQLREIQKRRKAETRSGIYTASQAIDWLIQEQAKREAGPGPLPGEVAGE
jgi:hypothetical protein